MGRIDQYSCPSVVEACTSRRGCPSAKPGTCGSVQAASPITPGFRVSGFIALRDERGLQTWRHGEGLSRGIPIILMIRRQNIGRGD